MYTRSIAPASHGNFYELYAIAAAVLGGFSLRGGEGSLIGVMLGVVLLQELQNLVNLLGIPSSLNFAVMGGVILIGVRWISNGDGCAPGRRGSGLRGRPPPHSRPKRCDRGSRSLSPRAGSCLSGAAPRSRQRDPAR